MVIEEKINAEIEGECVTDFICTSMPVAYRLRKTRNGGVELFGGHPVTDTGIQKRLMSVSNGM